MKLRYKILRKFDWGRILIARITILSRLYHEFSTKSINNSLMKLTHSIGNKQGIRNRQIVHCMNKYNRLKMPFMDDLKITIHLNNHNQTVIYHKK